jgi:dipeptidyl aminopeptidase/acylaminoacyl peptidase
MTEIARNDIRRYLNIRSATAPSISADGRSIAFLMNATGVPQVWRVPVLPGLHGGWPEQLTFYDDAVRSVHYPRSRLRGPLVFAMDSGGNERTQLYLTDDTGSEVRDLTSHREAIHQWGDWSGDGKTIAYSANQTNPARFDVYLQDVSREDGEARLLCEGPGGYFNAGHFSPDGKQLLALEYPSNSNQFVHVIDVATGDTRNLTPHEGEVRYLNPRWSPDGRGVYLLTDFHGDFLSLARIDLDGGALSFVERPEHDVETFEIARAAPFAWFAWTVNDGGISRLYARPLEGMDRPALSPKLPLGVVEQLAFSSDGRLLAFDLSGPRENLNVWIWEPGRRDAQRVTHASRAGVPADAFVEPTLVEYESFDGLKIPAWLYMPPRDVAQGKPPVIVYPHGGPESQARPAFNAIFAYLLNRGYAIFAPNVRGSSGYGTRFMNLDNVRRRMDSVEDLARGAFWLRDSGRIDPERMAVYGGSYGGFMVLAAITRYPDLYAAAVDVVGVANFVTFLENTGAYRRAAREAEYGSLQQDRDFLASISPIHNVDKIRTPLMVVHGANDPRVPVGEAEQIVAALKRRDVPVEFLRYEDEGHGLVKLSNRLDAYPRIAAFLDRYLRR